MVKRHKLLLLDDDPDFLDVYREMLAAMPSQPEIQTATSGARAISLLESEPFTLLLCDLNMPKMDGLQVLAIVRRRFPQLRTVVMTAMADEQYRTRAYGMGVDLFLAKPGTPEGTKLFLDCVESLLDRDVQTGFRGIQSKSLVDIIQLESMTQSLFGAQGGQWSFGRPYLVSKRRYHRCRGGGPAGGGRFSAHHGVENRQF